MRFLLSICIAMLCSISALLGQDSTRITTETKRLMGKPKPMAAPKLMPKKKEVGVSSNSNNFKDGMEIEAAPDLDWGQVDLEYLKMTSYDKDTLANEILLLNYSKVDRAIYQGQFGVMYHYHFRVKIFDKSKYQGGEIELLSDARDRVLKSSIKGQTINWVGGAIERVKVKEILTDDQGQGRMLYRFSFPEIMDGTVLEYKYSIFNPNPVLIADKYFQSSLPIVWSEYRFFEMSELEYKMIALNNPKFDYKRQETVEKNETHNGGTEYRWVIKDVPGVEEESYSSVIDNHLARMAIQLHSFDFNGRKEYVFKDWDSYCETYYNDADGMGQTSSSKNTKKLLKAMKSTLAGITSKKDKMVAIYEHVRDNVEWSGDYTMYISSDLKTVYKNKHGTSADINFLLIAALKHSGINAYPVLLSTRRNGKMYREYPLTKQFNHVITQVEIGGETYLLDAIYPNVPYNLLPFPDLNHEGLLIKNNNNNWINITATTAKKTVQVDLELTEDGEMAGTFEYKRDAYRGFESRLDIEEKGKEDYERDYFSSVFSDSKVTNLRFENEDDFEKPMIERMNFTCETCGQVAGDLIYFNLLMGLGFSENIFKAPKRNMPIEMPYPFIDDYSFKIKIPEGYMTEELPAEMNIALPNNTMVFKFTIEEKEGYLNYNAHLEINEMYYNAADYQAIKDFMDKVVEKQTSQIVVKKKPY